MKRKFVMSFLWLVKWPLNICNRKRRNQSFSIKNILDHFMSQRAESVAVRDLNGMWFARLQKQSLGAYSGALQITCLSVFWPRRSMLGGTFQVRGRPCRHFLENKSLGHDEKFCGASILETVSGVYHIMNSQYQKSSEQVLHSFLFQIVMNWVEWL